MNVSPYDAIFCAFSIVASTPTARPEIVPVPGSDHVMSSRMQLRIFIQSFARNDSRNVLAMDSFAISIITTPFHTFKLIPYLPVVMPANV